MTMSICMSLTDMSWVLRVKVHSGCVFQVLKAGTSSEEILKVGNLAETSWIQIDYDIPIIF